MHASVRTRHRFAIANALSELSIVKRVDGRRAAVLCVLITCLLIGGCATATPGLFVAGGGWESESFDFRPDGTFVYEFHSDEGGLQCRAFGTWSRVSGRIFETATKRIEDGAGRPSDTCRIGGIGGQRWRLSGRWLFRTQGAFKRR